MAMTAGRDPHSYLHTNPRSQLAPSASCYTPGHELAQVADRQLDFRACMCLHSLLYFSFRGLVAYFAVDLGACTEGTIFMTEFVNDDFHGVQ